MSLTVVDTCQAVDAKKRPLSVSIEHLQLCDPQGNGKGNLSKRKWHRRRRKTPPWWFTQSQITQFHRHLAVLLSHNPDRQVRPLETMGRRKKREGKHVHANNTRGKKDATKQKEAFSVRPWLSILPSWVVKMPLLARLFAHCFWEGRRSQRRGYQKKRDNLLMFVDI